MRYYFLALLIWITKIVLWLTIIGIPVERYLADNYSMFNAPFFYAEYYSN